MMFASKTTGIARIAAEAGAEFAVFDMEHTGWSIETIRRLMATSRSTELVPMVRVPSFQYPFIARVLDVGAMGIVVPLVADAAPARMIVDFARYPPQGRRGVAFGIAHQDYQAGDLLAKLRQAK
jgi:2-keto-3-deoxy-L-rhamnonate aldolase RhmA